MVVIPPGRFHMGSPDDEQARSDDEGPVHEVSIAYPFAVAKYPVTRGQWRQYLAGTGGSGSHNCYGLNQSKGQTEIEPQYSWLDPGFAQEDDHPVVCVRWDEAQGYANWLSQKTGHHYRLLSEAEYEYINRANTSSAYFWGSTDDGQCTYANGADASLKARYSALQAAGCNDGYVFTSPVGHFQPNAFGLYDTTGNVQSWTQDCWHNNYNGGPGDGSVWTLGGDCSNRVVRGGSFDYRPSLLRVASHGWSPRSLFRVGFRLAMSE
jgi:formylglycine-generating enzyme required for sulfatase activity